ncbi:MAG: NRDE family protein [Flavobacteriaceae bacterium]|nr:NRDE family protein [Flavobacteriaceae bacterium]
MCTVTFIAKGDDDFILTSNRDEIPNRKTLSPQEYTEENVRLVYPKDQVAGGTWIGVSDRNRFINLLNGGFEPHIRKASYRMSRGLVVKKLLTAEDVVLKIKDFDFEDIEPFTIIIVDWSSSLKLYRLVWDGVKKHFKELNLGNHIWSSSPLYSPEMKSKREEWLSEFIENNVTSAENLLEFHHNAGVGNKEIDLQMDRGFIKTVSITQIEKKNDQVKMTYKDLNSGESNRIEI